MVRVKQSHHRLLECNLELADSLTPIISVGCVNADSRVQMRHLSFTRMAKGQLCGLVLHTEAGSMLQHTLATAANSGKSLLCKSSTRDLQLLKASMLGTMYPKRSVQCSWMPVRAQGLSLD